MVKQDQHLDPEPQKAIGCPYAKCAVKPQRLALLSFGAQWWVYFKHCGGSGPIGHNEREAVELWNERHAETWKRPGTVGRVVLWFFMALGLGGVR